jgi:hypothetical protein
MVDKYEEKQFETNGEVFVVWSIAEI